MTSYSPFTEDMHLSCNVVESCTFVIPDVYSHEKTRVIQLSCSTVSMMLCFGVLTELWLTMDRHADTGPQHIVHKHSTAQ